MLPPTRSTYSIVRIRWPCAVPFSSSWHPRSNARKAYRPCRAVLFQWQAYSVFSSDEAKDLNDVYAEVRATCDGGDSGSMIGRKRFPAPTAEALEMLDTTSRFTRTRPTDSPREHFRRPRQSGFGQSRACPHTLLCR
jgi:hypothetical protein